MPSLIFGSAFVFFMSSPLEFWDYPILVFFSAGVRCSVLWLVGSAAQYFVIVLLRWWSGTVVTAHVLFALLGPGLSSSRPLLLSGLRVALVILVQSAWTLTGPMLAFRPACSPFSMGPPSVMPRVLVYAFWYALLCGLGSGLLHIHGSWLLCGVY